MPRPALSCNRFVAAPENRATWLAVQYVAACITSAQLRRTYNPLVVRGPSGSGKTHLAHALAGEVTRQCPDLIVTQLDASDLTRPAQPTLFDSADPQARPEVVEAARGSDLLIVEDLQHLALGAAETL